MEYATLFHPTTAKFSTLPYPELRLNRNFKDKNFFGFLSDEDFSRLLSEFSSSLKGVGNFSKDFYKPTTSLQTAMLMIYET